MVLKAVAECRTMVNSKLSLFERLFPKITFEIICSKGTYIRSLAHDFGKELNNGAHLSSLRREMIGDFSFSDAISIDSFKRNILK